MGFLWFSSSRGHYELAGGEQFDYFFLVSIFFTTVPLVALAAVIVVIILWAEVELSTSIFEAEPKPDYNAYFIDFSATTLVTLASWLSSISPYVPAFYMALLAFPFADHLRDQSRSGPSTAQLPTPCQLSMLIQLFNGSPRSIWDWLSLRPWKKRMNPLLILDRLIAIFCFSIFLR